MKRLWLLALLPLLSGLSGCANDCNRYCREMANYFEDCGISVGDTEVADCRATWRRNAPALPGTDANALATYGTVCSQMLAMEENADGDRVIALRARFTCDDMRDGPGGAFGGE